MSISIHIGQTNPAAESLRTTAGQRTEQKSSSGTVYFGDLDLGQDPVRSKLEQARKQAYRLASDAFGAEQDFQESLKKLRSFITEKKEERGAAAEDQKAAEEAIAGLREEYDVDPDSKEQQDLDWLIGYRKQSMMEKMRDPEQFERDQARKKEIESNLTEYQSRMLEADDRLTDATKRYNDADEAIHSARQSLTDAESEHRKSHAMADAKREGEELMAAAEKEVIGIVINDAKDKLDEKVKEEQEKKEEKKEEEEAAEKLEQERAEQQAIREAFIEGAKDAVLEAKERADTEDTLDPTELIGAETALPKRSGGQLDAALDELKNKLALVDADLMGLKVDESI